MIVTSTVWENLSYYGSVAIRLATKPCKTVIKMTKISRSMICPLKKPPNFKSTYTFLFYFYISFFLSCLLPSSFIIIHLLAPDEDSFLSKPLVVHCFLVFRRIGEYISLDLFYQFCQPQLQLFTHSSEKGCFLHIVEITRVVVLHTSLLLVEGVCRPQRACVG